MRNARGFLGWMVLAVMTPGAHAQVPEGWPEHIDVGVRESIAERWGVESESVRLAWGEYHGAIPAAGSVIELVGSGRGGHWVVRITAASGGTSTIRLRGGFAAVRAVAAHRLERGVALVSADVVMRDTIIWHDPAGGPQPSLRGWVTHRRIERGEALAGPAVQPPLAVEAGRSVEVIWQRGPIGVRLTGIAEGSAAVGEDVFVRTESGTRLIGTVVAPGIVRLTRAKSRATTGGIS